MIFYSDNATSGGNVSSLLVSSSEARLFGCIGYNSGPEQFIQIHDASSLPDDGAVPVVSIKVDAAKNFCIDYGEIGRKFDNGIVFCNSSTQSTKTIASADCFFDVQYRDSI